MSRKIAWAKESRFLNIWRHCLICVRRKSRRLIWQMRRSSDLSSKNSFSRVGLHQWSKPKIGWPKRSHLQNLFLSWIRMSKPLSQRCHKPRNPSRRAIRGWQLLFLKNMKLLPEYSTSISNSAKNWMNTSSVEMPLIIWSFGKSWNSVISFYAFMNLKFLNRSTRNSRVSIKRLFLRRI